MTFTAEKTVGELHAALKAWPALAADDSVARATRLLRARNTPVLLVSDGYQFVGMVHEGDLLARAASAASPKELARTTRVSEVMRPIAVTLWAQQPLSEAARRLAAADVPAAPVAGSDGRYLGLLFRRDVLAALSGEPMPPPMSGIATPFGVYLSTGSLRAGPRNLALAATGGMLAALGELANAGMGPLYRAAHQFVPERVAEAIAYAAPFVFFLLLLRLSPISGLHAAEHMVVHAIEEGEDLTLEKVRPMDRVHPRCGTNLFALVLLVTFGGLYVLAPYEQADRATGGLASLTFIVVVLLTWRWLGYALQRFITTKRPSDRQLAGAIRVGEELLAQIAEHPEARSGALKRIWNGALPRVLAGFLVVWGAVWAVEWLISRR